jgi:hypothetical protein
VANKAFHEYPHWCLIAEAQRLYRLVPRLAMGRGAFPQPSRAFHARSGLGRRASTWFGTGGRLNSPAVMIGCPFGRTPRAFDETSYAPPLLSLGQFARIAYVGRLFWNERTDEFEQYRRRKLHGGRCGHWWGHTVKERHFRLESTGRNVEWYCGKLRRHKFVGWNAIQRNHRNIQHRRHARHRRNLEQSHGRYYGYWRNFEQSHRRRYGYWRNLEQSHRRHYGYWRNYRNGWFYKRHSRLCHQPACRLHRDQPH